MRYLLLIALFFILGCSTKSPINNWQYQSVNSYKNFERYFLENRMNLASIELDRARSYASQSADLRTLARIELSSCALHVSVLFEYNCPRYDALKDLIDDKDLDSYASFLSDPLHVKEVSKLPAQYRSFAQSLSSSELSHINTKIQSISPLSSQMIAAALAQDHLNHKSIEKIITSASHHGFKYAVIRWLDFSLQKTSDPQIRESLLMKLKILKNK